MSFHNRLTFVVSLILMFTSNVLGFSYRMDCECGTTSHEHHRIYNGEETRPHQYPWVVYLEKHDWNEEDYYVCGGSIINSFYVLTAAHCVEDVRKEAIYLYVSVHNKNTLDYGNSYGVEKVIIHPLYDPTTIASDIALLRLTKELKFSAQVKPICLPRKTERAPHRGLVTAGWGDTETGEVSDVLKHATLHLLSQRSCFEYLNQDTDSNIASFMVRKVVCAYDRWAIPCHGDSGGPLMYMRNRRYFGFMVITGLLSFGHKCPVDTASLSRLEFSKVNVFTKVASYLDWIDKNTADSAYCRRPSWNGLAVK